MAGHPATPPETLIFRRGECLMREGDPGTVAYLIQQGQLQVYMERKGRKIQLAMLGKNQIVGELALIDQMPRSATVVAVEDTIVVPIDLSRLRQIMQTQPDLAISLVRVLVRKIRDTDKLLASVFQKI